MTVRGPADLVIINGKVVTVDQSFSIAQAVAVRENRIMAVGRQADIIKLIDGQTEVLDLKGKTILPGFNDAHFHLCWWATTMPPLAMNLLYPNVKSISEIVELVKEKAASLPPGEWIRGFSWDEAYLDEWRADNKRYPTRWDLDAVSPHHPVCLTHYTGHIIWVNSKALEMAGVNKDTPDPKGGQIVRHPSTGEPTGMFNESEASNLVQKIIPPFTMQEKRDGILAMMDEVSSLGITSGTESYVGPNSQNLAFGAFENDLISLYNTLHQEGRLKVRISLLVSFGELVTPGGLTLEGMKQYLHNVATNTGFGNEWVKIAGLKLAADSMTINKTSWVYEPYVGGGTGQLLTQGETEEERYDELIKMIAYASKRRFQVGVHVLGDRAIDAVVDGFIKALEEDPWDARHCVIHANLTTPECARRMAKHNICANINSILKWQIADWEETVLGPERAAYEWPAKTLMAAGVNVSNGSDCAACYPDPIRGIWAAVTRIARASGKVSGPGERLTRQEAIRTYTINGAWQDHSERIKGSIEAGKLADCCVLDQDILTVDVDKMPEIKNVMTILDGRIVYNADPDELRTIPGDKWRR